ncbi:MAG: hypothetical protein M9894_36660 [Planctomycetes bacterium]|nr:hypothetical protein [Planctomycetota bacterium]
MAGVLVVASWGVVLAQDAEQAKADREWLVQTWEEHYKTLNYVSKDHNFNTARNALRPGRPIGKDVQDKLGKLEALEQGALPAITERLDQIMSGRYGSSDFNQVAQKIEGLTGGRGPARGSGGSRATTVPEALSGLGKGVMGIQDLRKETADVIMRAVDAELASTQRLRPDYDAVRAFMEYAARWNPADAAIKGRLAGWDEEVKAHRAKGDPLLDAATGPEPYALFAGPGDAGELSKSALEWLNHHEGDAQFSDPDEYGERREFLHVIVRGDWRSLDKDALGQTTQWFLPLHCAYTTERLKKDGVCVWREWSIMTMKESGVQKAPPWKYANPQGPVQQMRIANLPAGAAKPSGGGGGGGGVLVWVCALLVVLLVLGGAGAAAVYVLVLKKPAEGAAPPAAPA